MLEEQKTTFSISDVAIMLSVGYQHVYNAVLRGELPAQKVKGRYVILPSGLRKYLLQDDAWSSNV